MSYAATPVQAAMAAVAAKPRDVVRVNVRGKFATVLFRGGYLEGAPPHAPILLEKFAFGWQPLESLDFRCRLDVHVSSPKDRRALMEAMPAPQPDKSANDCDPRDAGSGNGLISDQDAIRMQMQGPLVPYVAVARPYALADWYGAGGGQALFRWNAHGWRLIRSVGGALGADDMVQYGVPKQYWCALHVANAYCAPGTNR